jgi:hypothetical protein
MQNRRDWLHAAGSGALAALISSPGQATAQEEASVPNDPFIVLLKGIYRPVNHTSNLGLSVVNLSDGSYSRTQIYPVFGISGRSDEEPDRGNRIAQNPIGTFYAQTGMPGTFCAYNLPGGAIAMQFLSGTFTPHPDGQGGQFLEATFELTILEATGVYHAFEGGHNHMVDRLHQLADGRMDEFCFCNISQYPFP